MSQSIRRSTILLLLILLAAAPAMAGEIRLSVAASLKEVINELTAKYEKAHPGTVFVNNYGASGALAGQIEHGAPADLFISANIKWMDHLKEKKLVQEKSIGNFARNTLVFTGSTGIKVTGMNDLARLDKIGIGSPKSVPAGEYAQTAIKNAGLEQQLQGKLVIAKDVRECLMYAELGEVDGSFVYRTDALQGKKTKLLFTVPQKLYPEVVYPVALTVKGATNRDAEGFFNYLKGREAKSVLKKYGFIL
ncbi:MAG: molybdate ABC transporter substrate-binding protein [Chlorobi bacterium]|nr:molybdate ABC transporter substrate-binding protein [Chlorobiota bacterium]